MKLLKRPWFIGSIIALPVIIVGVVMLWASSQYHSAVNAYAAEVAQKIASTNSFLKNMQNDSAKTAAALASLQNSLATNHMPHSTVFTNNADRTRSSDITNALHDFIAQLQIERDVMAYDQVATTVLQAAPTQDAATIAGLQALANGWQQTADKLKALAAPSVLSNAHQQLTAAVSQVRATLATLANLFANNDYDGFASTKLQLEKDVAAVRALAGGYKKITQNQDNILAARYQTLAPLITP